MKKLLLGIVAFFVVIEQPAAQDSFSVRAQRYVEQYSKFAINEQIRCGIPASVTLAQGILETEAGNSELATQANNHFGIKCKSGYTGETFLHDDDAPSECFRKYKCAEESYKDHSDYLKRNPRYNPLFSLSATDYAGWAICLKKCGYATNPQYAQRLIKIIEDFRLQQYTYSALDSAAPKTYLAQAVSEPAKAVFSEPAKDTTPPDPVATPQSVQPKDTIKIAETATPTMPDPLTPKALTDTGNKSTAVEPLGAPAPLPAPQKDIVYDSGKVMVLNGLRAFMAKKGEMLLQYAVKYNVHYAKLLEYNDLNDGPLPEDLPVYLEKKLSSGTHAKHTVKEGESVLLIAQLEGIQLKRLMALNMLDVGEEPAPGVILDLQKGAVHKPGLRPAPPVDLTTANNLSYVKPTPGADFVQIDHSRPAKVAEPEPTPTPTPAKEITQDSYVVTIPLPKDTTAAIASNTAAPTDTSIAATDTPATDELAALKAELDKVVYADDSKLLPPPQVGKHEPVVISASPNGPLTNDETRTNKNSGAGNSTYTVKKGDTLSGIARKNGVTVSQLMKLNRVKEQSLRPGQKLRLK